MDLKKLDRLKNQLAESEHLQTDGSIGFCIEDFKSGFDASSSILLLQIEAYKKALRCFDNVEGGEANSARQQATEILKKAGL